MKKIKASSMIFYASFMKAAREGGLSKAERCVFYEGLIDYATTGELPSFEHPLYKSLFILCKELIDANSRRFSRRTDTLDLEDDEVVANDKEDAVKNSPNLETADLTEKTEKTMDFDDRNMDFNNLKETHESEKTLSTFNSDSCIKTSDKTTQKTTQETTQKTTYNNNYTYTVTNTNTFTIYCFLKEKEKKKTKDKKRFYKPRTTHPQDEWLRFRQNTRNCHDAKYGRQGTQNARKIVNQFTCHIGPIQGYRHPNKLWKDTG